MKKKKKDNYDSEDGPEYIEEDLNTIEDNMLEDDDDIDERSPDAVVQMLRDIECSDCTGSSSKEKCSVRDAHGCPPDKRDK